MHVLSEVRVIKSCTSKHKANKEIYVWAIEHSHVQWTSWSNILFVFEESFEIEMQGNDYFGVIVPVRKHWVTSFGWSRNWYVLYWGLRFIGYFFDWYFDKEKRSSCQK